MRVFVLCTGRCGSWTLTGACKQITNYTSGHETRVGRVDGRLDYPDQHIEIDNRLSWFLGPLEETYGDEPVYVHLQRDREEVARSWARRLLESSRKPGLRGRVDIVLEAARVGGKRDFYRGMASAFAHDIISQPAPWAPDQQLEACRLYVDTVTANIRSFLKDKSKVVHIDIATAAEDFPQFWDLIGAEGDLDAALAEFDVRYNPSGRTQDERLKRWR